MPRSVVAIALVALLAVGAFTAHAISSKRCAKKCTFQTGSCVIERGVAQCGTADPARPCLDALDAQCESESVASCVASNGKSCKKPTCADKIAEYCACQAAAPYIGVDGVELPLLCTIKNPKCRRRANCTSTTTSTTLPPVGGDEMLLCCIFFPEPGSDAPCTVGSQMVCPLAGSTCQSEFANGCVGGGPRQSAIPAQAGQSCQASYDCQ